MDECQKGVIWGFIVGCVLTMLLCIVIANEVEKRKVAKGYLTFHKSVYTVKLYDTLDVPEREGE